MMNTGMNPYSKHTRSTGASSKIATNSFSLQVAIDTSLNLQQFRKLCGLAEVCILACDNPTIFLCGSVDIDNDLHVFGYLLLLGTYGPRWVCLQIPVAVRYLWPKMGVFTDTCCC